jgi:hypothetical protein
MRIMWDNARRVGVLVATGYILFREQDITNRPMKLAIRNTTHLFESGYVYGAPNQLGLSFYPR